jgi:hypothetical protein
VAFLARRRHPGHRERSRAGLESPSGAGHPAGGSQWRRARAAPSRIRVARAIAKTQSSS